MSPLHLKDINKSRRRETAAKPYLSGFPSLLSKSQSVAAVCLLAVWFFGAVSGANAAPITASAGNMQLSLAFQPDPPGAGQNHLTLLVRPEGAVDGASVALGSSMYTMKMGGPSVKAIPSGGGRYTADLLFGMGGPWQVTARIARPGSPPVSANFRFNVSSDPVAPSSPSPVASHPAPSDSSAGKMSNAAPSGEMSSTKDSGSGGMSGMAMGDMKDSGSPDNKPVGSVSAGPYEVTIDTTPPPIGQGTIMIHVRDRQTHQLVSDGKVIARASMPSMPMGETYHQASPVPGHPGEFQLTWPFQMVGQWEIKAEFQGPKGTSDAAAPVSPGAFVFPRWAEILMGLAGLGLVIVLLNMTRTANGRERLRGMAQRKNLLALLILIAIAAGAWFLVQHFKAGQVDWNQMSMQMQDYTAPTPVSVQPAKYSSIGEVTTYTGAVAPYVEDTISPRVTGRILLAPYAGTRVTAGQVIVQMEQPDLVAKAVQGGYGTVAASHDVMEAQDRERQAHDAEASARSALGSAGDMVRQTTAKVESARADATYWASEIKRERFLLAHGAVSLDEYQGELDKARAAVEAVDAAVADQARAMADQTTAGANLSSAIHGITLARHQVEHTYAMLDQSRAAQSESAATAGYLTIRAPVTGVITSRMADPGTVVSPGTPILKLAELDRMRVQANISAADLGKIGVGTPLTAVAAGNSIPITARVTSILPAANEATRTSVVEAVIPNPGQRLLPGEFLTLQFHGQAAKRTLIAPVTAIVSMSQATGSSQGTDGNGIWTAVDGTAHLVSVTLGATNGTNQQVLSGLKEGDLIIVGGGEGLTEGAAITYPGMPQMTPQSQATSGRTPPNGNGGLTQKAGDLTVALSFQPSPPKVGEDQLLFTITDTSGSPVKGATVQIKSEMSAMSMGGPSGTAKDQGNGTYSMPLTMGMGGAWRITASVTAPGKPAINAVFNVKAE